MMKKILGGRVLRGTFAVIAVGFLGFSTYICLFPEGTADAANTATTSVTVTVNPIIEMAISSKTLQMQDASSNTSITPSSSGTEISGSVTVRVTTNDASGYSLAVKTSDSTTDMKNTNSSVTTGITSVSTSGVSSLTANKWGFRVNNTGNWYGVGASSETYGTSVLSSGSVSSYCSKGIANADGTINTSAGCAAGTYQDTVVTFGAKVTDALPAGTYQNNVVFTATAK